MHSEKVHYPRNGDVSTFQGSATINLTTPNQGGGNRLPSTTLFEGPPRNDPLVTPESECSTIQQFTMLSNQISSMNSRFDQMPDYKMFADLNEKMGQILQLQQQQIEQIRLQQSTPTRSAATNSELDEPAGPYIVNALSLSERDLQNVAGEEDKFRPHERGTERISSSDSEEENGLCPPSVACQASQRPHLGRSVLPLPMRMRAEKSSPTSLNAAPTPPNSATIKGSQFVATPMELEILTQLEVLKQQQQQILIHLQRLSNVGSICSTDYSQLEVDLAFFPLADFDSLMKLENELRLNQDLRKKLISFFGVIGGMTVKETVWRILKKLLTNTLSKEINWKGVNGKHSFSATILREIINNSVRKNTFCSKATDVEVEKYVKRWLQLAGYRDGGRKDRNTRADKNP